MNYDEALIRTDPSRLGTIKKGSTAESAAIERFKDFFSVLSEQNVRAKVRQVYAAEAYLNDTLKEISGIDQIEAYFLKSARAVEECTVEMLDVAESNGNYYFRWVMCIRFKKFKPNQVCCSRGMTHIRFNSSGQVVFHHDYWDAAGGLFEHIPVVGTVIRAIKARL
ncbi:MAG: nuclear transport factor 2 family protein [Acidobacteriota bacterium]|nr:nuclear transport factor 2 family protein [Blastocatellia bacterium]MDW8238172.1 nuclear transport factor 2 family protein [Acidobacteriota bacterium]